MGKHALTTAPPEGDREALEELMRSALVSLECGQDCLSRDEWAGALGDLHRAIDRAQQALDLAEMLEEQRGGFFAVISRPAHDTTTDRLRDTTTGWL